MHYINLDVFILDSFELKKTLLTISMLTGTTRLLRAPWPEACTRHRVQARNARKQLVLARRAQASSAVHMRAAGTSKIS